MQMPRLRAEPTRTLKLAVAGLGVAVIGGELVGYQFVRMEVDGERADDVGGQPPML